MSGPENEAAVADDAKADARYRNGRAMRRAWELGRALVERNDRQSREAALTMAGVFAAAQLRARKANAIPSRHTVHGPATDVVRQAAASGMLTQEEAERLIQELKP